MKTIQFVLALCLVFSFSSTGQPGSWLWAESAGGMYYDYGSAVCADPYGNVYVAGNFNNDSISFGNVKLPNNGQSDFFVAKYTSTGALDWARAWGGSGSDNISSITLDPAGKLFITGAFSSTMLIGANLLTSRGGADIFVAVLDTAGTPTWATSWGGTDMEWNAAIRTDDIGNVYVNGSFDSPEFNIGTDSIPNSGIWSDVFLVKMNPAGSIAWLKGIHGPDEENAMGLAVDGVNGDILMTGYYYSDSVLFDTLRIYNPQNGNIYVAKYNTNGDVQWAKKFGGPSNIDYPDGIETDPGGNSYITGIFYSDSIQFDNIYIVRDGSANLFLAKLDPYGNALWATSSHGSGYSTGYQVAIDSLASVYVTGDFDGPTVRIGNDTLLNLNPGLDNKALMVAKFDSSGNLIWLKGANGIPYNYAYGICSVPNAPGDVFVTGAYTNSSLAFDNDTVTSAGGQDMFVARLSSLLTGTTDEVRKNITVSIYPNPVRDQFYIDTGKEPIHFTIHNLQGQLVGECLSNRILDVGYLSDSVYILKCETAAFRFVKVRE